MRKPNKGWFAPGFDARRHVLSRAERRKEYDVLQMKIRLKQIPSRVAAHVRKKIRGYYRDREARRRAQ